MMSVFYLELLTGSFEELDFFCVLFFLYVPPLCFLSLDRLAFSLLLVHQPLQISLLTL